MRGPGSSRQDSFSDYYLRRVAHSEGCGCAELIVSREWRDREQTPVPGTRGFLAGWRARLGRLLRRVRA